MKNIFIIFLLSLAIFSCGKKKEKTNQNEVVDSEVIVKKKDDNFSGKKVALIIGNAEYENSAWTLKNPTNDATDFANLLKKLNFEVIKYTNLDQKGMQKAVSEFANKLSSGDVGLFYFAGHGLQIKNTDYILPIDVSAENENDIEINCFDVNKMLNLMKNSGTFLNLIVLDACRNNPIRKKTRSLDRGLTTVNENKGTSSAPRGSIIMYAASSGEVAMDGDGKNGLFTSELIQQIKNGRDKSLIEIVKNTQQSVNQRSNGQQMPEFRDFASSHFYFIGGNVKNNDENITKREERKEEETVKNEDDEKEEIKEEKVKEDFSKTSGTYSSYDYDNSSITEYLVVNGKSIYYTNSRIGKDKKIYGDIRYVNEERGSYRDYTVHFSDLNNTTYRIKIMPNSLTSTDFENNTQTFKKISNSYNKGSKNIEGSWRSVKEEDYYEIEKTNNNIRMRGTNFSGVCYKRKENEWHGTLHHEHSDLTVEVRVYMAEDGTLVIYNKQQGKNYHFEKQN